MNGFGLAYNGTDGDRICSLATYKFLYGAET
jgi:hypothetical protein